MSFRIQPTAPARPNRCQLFGPGSRPAIFEKMASSDADVINLDLEDSVAPTDKDSARANIIKAISDVDWGDKTLSVRINGLDTPYWYRDIVDLLEQAGERLGQVHLFGDGTDRRGLLFARVDRRIDQIAEIFAFGQCGLQRIKIFLDLGKGFGLLGQLVHGGRIALCDTCRD